MGLLFHSLLVLAKLGGQVTTGTLTGKVRDALNAPLPGVQVVITSQDTGLTFRQSSNEEGYFYFPSLLVGFYKIKVEMEGFRLLLALDQEVLGSRTTRVDFRMVPGSISQTIEVRGDTISLPAESSSVQQGVSSSLISSLPNLNRNPLYYASLQAGVVPRAAFNDTQSMNAFGIGIGGRRYFSAFSVNGGQSFTNDILLDGLSILGSAWHEATILPNPDAVEEVQTTTNVLPPEFGRAQGIVALVTQKGGNQFHGMLYDRLRHDRLNANRYGNRVHGISRPPFKVSTYGASLGGPLWRDRHFFFVSYEGLVHSDGVDYLRKVPTERERRGDFSETLVAVSGVPTHIRLFNPYQVAPVPGQPNVYARQEIPGAILPQTDPYASQLVQAYPLPNRPTTDPYNTNNYYHRGTRTFSRNSLNSRMDWNFGRHSFYSTFGFSQGEILTSRSWGESNPYHSPTRDYAGNRVADWNPYFYFGDTIVLSPQLLMEARYGFSRIATESEADQFDGFDYGALGIPVPFQAINAAPGAAPDFAPEYYSHLNKTNSQHKRERQANHTFSGSLTKVQIRWLHKLGGEFRTYLSNYTDPEASFTIRTNSSFTRQFIDAQGNGVGTAPENLAGWALASILLGAGEISVPPSRNTQPALAQKYLAFFSQNDWHLFPTLTLNLGLRWDFQPGPTERFDRISGFDFSSLNPYGTRGSIVFADQNKNGRNYWKNTWSDFGPRVGGAWQILSNLVLRGGFGITFLPTNTGYFGTSGMYGMDSFAPYSRIDYYGEIPQGLLQGRYYEVSRVVEPSGPDPGWPGLYGGGEAGRWRMDRNEYRNGRVQQWNLSLDVKSGSSWLFSASYLGAKGIRLPFSRLQLNSLQLIDPSLLSAWREDYLCRNGTGHAGNDLVPNPFQPDPAQLIPFNGSLGRAYLSRQETYYPYPHFGQMQIHRSVGFSDHHALQLRVERKFFRGFAVMGHYSWSKSLEFGQTEPQTNGFADTGGYSSRIDQRYWQNNRKPAYTDIPQRGVISWRWDLPWGRKRQIPISHPAWKAMAENWQVAGTFLWQSGPPLEIFGASENSLNNRPDRVPGIFPELPTHLQRWYDGKTTITLPGGRLYTPCAGAAPCFLKFNPEAFQGRVASGSNGKLVPDLFWYGTSAYTFTDIRGEGLVNWNLSVRRDFDLSDRIKLEFSAQATNLINHSQFRPAYQMNLGNLSTWSLESPENPSRLRPGQGNSSTFGTHDVETFDPRQVEFSLRLRF